MKVVLCLLVLLPLAMTRTIEVNERSLLDLNLNPFALFEGIDLAQIQQILASTLGTGVAKSTCESNCPTIIGNLQLIPNDSLLLWSACSIACAGLDSVSIV